MTTERWHTWELLIGAIVLALVCLAAWEICKPWLPPAFEETPALAVVDTAAEAEEQMSRHCIGLAPSDTVATVCSEATP